MLGYTKNDAPISVEEKYIIPTTFQQSELFFQTYFWGMDNEQTKDLCQRSPPFAKDLL